MRANNDAAAASEVIGQWCKLGTHDSCTGAWRGARCICTCHGYFIDLARGSGELSIDDRQQVRAFAAFLRHAASRGPLNGPVEVTPEWHAWLTGTGPTPDPDSPVGPEPAERCGGNHG